MLRATYITGSWCFLKNVRDIDVIYYYDTREEALEALKHNKKDHRYNEHYRGIDQLPRIFLGAYIYPFMKLRSGEDLHLEQYSIFDFKEEYIAKLKHVADWLPREDKKWYQILTGVYILENGNYELTEEQLENIQLVHDSEYINCDLYNHIIDYLSKM